MTGISRNGGDISTSPRDILGSPWGEQDDVFRWKCAMLLLGQDTWIERRVETVTFTEQGTTRRNIGFDFLVPRSMRLPWRESGTDRTLVAVPLTFLGKGDLIHADVSVAGGEPVPLLRLDDNKDIAIAALDYCFEQIEDHDRLLELCGALACQWSGEHTSFSVRAAHAGIVCSPVDVDDVNGSRRRRIRGILDRLYGPSAAGTISGTVGTRQDYEHTGTDDRYRSQTLSAETLIHALEEYAASAPVPEPTDALTTYLLLLSSLCESYVCVAIIPEDQANGRCLVKLSFDSSYQESAWDRYMLPSSEQLDLSFQTDAAQSTHIEINPIGGSSIALVEWDLRGERRTRIRSSVAAGRVHISAGKRDRLPSLHLHLTLLNKLPTILANCAWSLLLLLGCIANAVVIGHPQMVGEIPDTLGSVADILALLFTLWVARRINSFDHSVSQDLTRYPNILISANLLVVSLSCVMVGATAMFDGFAVPALGLSIVCVVLSLVLSLPVFHGLVVWRRCRHGVPAYHLNSAGDKVVVNKRNVTFLRDSGTVPLPQYNGGYLKEDQTDSKNGKDERPKMDEATRKLIVRDAKRRSHWKRTRVFLDRHVFRDDNSRSSNPSLYPADHSPYLVLEGTGHTESSLKAKAQFVAVRWHSDPLA